MDLTRDQILALTAGREIDALIEDLLGVPPAWMVAGHWVDAKQALCVCGHRLTLEIAEKHAVALNKHGRREDFRPIRQPAQRYSSDMAAAWTVVEHLRTHGIELLIQSWPDGGYAALFTMPDGHDTGDALGDAPLAICRAALAIPARYFAPK